MHTLGRVAKIDTMTCIDGRGLRAMVFLAGCPLRCRICHNPEMSWACSAEDASVGSVVERLRRLREYHVSGITVSGGEPLAQPAFCAALMGAAKAELGMSAALDTSGVGTLAAVHGVLPNVDEVLWCIKSAVPSTYRSITGASCRRARRFGEELAKYQGISWTLRYVVLPGYTDTAPEVEALIRYAKEGPAASTLEAIELLPYHRMGIHKWVRLGLDYPLLDTPPPPRERVDAIAADIRAAGLRCTLPW